MVRLPPRLRPYFPHLKAVYTQSTRFAAPINRQLGRLRGGHLPTGSVATMELAAESTGGRSVLARPAETISRVGAHGLPPAHPMFCSFQETIPRVAIAELPNGRVLGTQSAVITANGDILQELSAYFGTTRPQEHPLFLNPFPGDPRQVSGRLGVLATRGDQNYYHFLVDALPRLALFAQAQQIDPPEHWYVPAAQPFQRELLELIGLREPDYIDSVAFPHVQAQTLVVPGLPSTTVTNPPWVVGWLRGKLLADRSPIEPTESIYVTRGSAANNRVVTNEAEVVESLAARGFTVIDPGRMSVTEQIDAFARAALIVAPHGAALTNLIFASPGSAVVELLPSGAVLPNCYWTLADNVPGLQYRYLLSGGRPAAARLAAALVSDIVVDLPQLDRLLDELVARRAHSGDNGSTRERQ
ncbi:MAG: glycosyltransferase family 61 protein [Jatrophihabitantaceae bacterium]